jgi:two-component system, NtrC family, sensor histidine kinase PilS
MEDSTSIATASTKLNTKGGGATVAQITPQELARQKAGWQSLLSFTIYRLIIVIILTITFFGLGRFQAIGGAQPLLALLVLVGYLAAAIGLIFFVYIRWPSLGKHLFGQVLVDVVALTLLMHASGGTRSGIGLLLLVTLAAAGVAARARMAYFHAAIAAIAILMEQSWQFLALEASAGDFVPAGLLAASCFVIAGLGHTLAKYAQGAEKIAEERGVDLANLSQINEMVIRDIQDGFVVVDEHGMIRQHNPQSEVLVGGLQGSMGQPLAAVAPILATTLLEWRRDRRRKVVIARDAVTGKDYQMRIVAVRPDENSPIVIFLEDASRVRSQAQQMKLVALGRLTASIAHEIRNPLSSINHAAELLQEDAGRSDADKRLLSIIQENSHRLDRMVQEVLYLNRRDRAHPEAIEAQTCLTQFVHDFCANEKIAPGIISLDVTARKRMIFDRSHFDQILWNLVRNAVRHGKKQPGSVIVSAHDHLQGHLVELSVEEDGPGVPVDSLPHLFEPFFTTDNQGTGLGLYIARELAEVNNARLEYLGLDDHSRLSGARFRITMNAE